MNAVYAALVTGVVSMKNDGTRTVWAGCSLSRAHGSLDVPIVNGPPGTGTSAGRLIAPAGAAAAGAAVRTGAPLRNWCVISIVSSCCCSCWTIIPNAKPPVTRRGPLKRAPSSRSRTRPRTSAA